MGMNISLDRWLKDADERVRQAAADALNQAADELEKEMRSNMEKQGIKERTGELKASFKITKATPEKIMVLVNSEVYAKDKSGKKYKPKNPGRDNPDMKNRYRYGVPYGRILEFSPKKSKPFFYTAWYELKKNIKEEVMEKIGNAWAGN